MPRAGGPVWRGRLKSREADGGHPPAPPVRLKSKRLLDELVDLAASPLPNLREAERILRAADEHEPGWWVDYPE